MLAWRTNRSLSVIMHLGGSCSQCKWCNNYGCQERPSSRIGHVPELCYSRCLNTPTSIPSSPLPSPSSHYILQHPPHLDSYTEEPTVRRILLGTTLPCATAHSIYHIWCWCSIISSPDDDTLVLPLNQHVPEHVVCQSIDMRGVLVGGLGRGRGGEGRGGEGRGGS